MFKGFGGLGDMFKLMKIVQEMQEKMVVLQDEMDSMIVLGESGVGLVKVMVLFKGELWLFEIDLLIFVVSEKEMVEDLIFVVIKDVQIKVSEKVQVEMVKFIGGFGLFEGMKFLF